MRFQLTFQFLSTEICSLLGVGGTGDICMALGSASAYSEGKKEIGRVSLWSDWDGIAPIFPDAVLLDT